MHTNASDRRGLEALMVPENSGNERQRQEDRRGAKRPHEDDAESDDDQKHDEVRLWEDGFKDRYYESKFDVSAENLEFR